MSVLHLLLFGLGSLALGDGLPPSSGPFVDPAQLREMLEDRQHPRLQSQAALLLVQSREKDAEEIVRGLKLLVQYGLEHPIPKARKGYIEGYAHQDDEDDG